MDGNYGPQMSTQGMRYKQPWPYPNQQQGNSNLTDLLNRIMTQPYMRQSPSYGNSASFSGTMPAGYSPISWDQKMQASMPIGNGAMRQPGNGSPFSMYLKQRGGM